MWNKFDGINEMIYFILTKYEEDIFEINLATLDGGKTVGTEFSKEVSGLDAETAEEVYNKTGKLWAYVNPKTMTPYPDDYWFSQGEPYYIKSLTFAPKGKKLKLQQVNFLVCICWWVKLILEAGILEKMRECKLNFHYVRFFLTRI